jgi:hypothetical protein
MKKVVKESKGRWKATKIGPIQLLFCLAMSHQCLAVHFSLQLIFEVLFIYLFFIWITLASKFELYYTQRVLACLVVSKPAFPFPTFSLVCIWCYLTTSHPWSAHSQFWTSNIDLRKMNPNCSSSHEVGQDAIISISGMGDFGKKKLRGIYILFLEFWLIFFSTL